HPVSDGPTDLFAQDTFEELIRLCDDLPAIFTASTTTSQDKKEVMRTLIQRVFVTDATRERIAAVVHWSDGSEPTPLEAPLAGHAHKMIERLHCEGLGTRAIADRLTELGILTSRGRPWNPMTIWQALHYRSGGPRIASTNLRKPRE